MLRVAVLIVGVILLLLLVWGILSRQQRYIDSAFWLLKVAGASTFIFVLLYLIGRKFF